MEGLIRGGQGQLAIAVLRHPLRDRGDDELVPGGEQLVDGRQRDMSPPGHLPELNRVIAAGFEQADYRAHDDIAGRWLGHVVHSYRSAYTSGVTLKSPNKLSLTQ